LLKHQEMRSNIYRNQIRNLEKQQEDLSQHYGASNQHVEIQDDHSYIKEVEQSLKDGPLITGELQRTALDATT